jgi:hypothetical protein
MNEITTTDFAKFGYREKDMAGILLKAMKKQGLPEDFYDNEVTIMMNMNSGNVFFTNSEYQVVMMNGSKLCSFYSCPECGCEGFKAELKRDGKACCRKYLKELNA